MLEGSDRVAGIIAGWTEKVSRLGSPRDWGYDSVALAFAPFTEINYTALPDIAQPTPYEVFRYERKVSNHKHHRVEYVECEGIRLYERIITV